jgi:hypothetical protein
MRILLCDRKSGLYLKAPGQWTDQAGQACNFQSGPKAILFARENQLNEAEVFWDFDDPEYSVRLPVSPVA